jgi:ABC-2 type transport system permease protein
MNIYRRELKSIRTSLIVWCFGIFLLIAASMAKYAATSAGGSIQDIMNQLPAALQALFGVGFLDYSKASGFYAVIYQYLLLMAAIHASMLGAVIISKEERDRTSEFLFVKPATRTQAITSKIEASLTAVVILNAVTWLTTIGLLAYYGKGENVSLGIAKLMIGMLLVQLVFLFMGTAAASLFKRSKAATGIATGVMLTTFFIYIAIDVNGKIDWMKPLTPFMYFDPKYLLYGGSFEWGFILLCVALIAAFFAATYFFFKRRDLRV